MQKIPLNWALQLTPTQPQLMVMAAEAENPSVTQRQGESDDSSTPRVLPILAVALERLVARNEQLGRAEAANVKVFDGVRAPSISIPKYLERIYKYTKCSPSCFVVGYAYIDRLVHRHPQLLLVSINVHRLLVTSVMLASKMFDDEHYDNAFYARVGGVSNAEMNRLELELLFLLDFDVMLKPPEFEIYCYFLEREMSRFPAAHLPPASILNIVDQQEEKDDIHEFPLQLA